MPARSDISISQPKCRTLLSHVAPVQLADKGPVCERTARLNRIDRVGTLAESAGCAATRTSRRRSFVQRAHLGHDREPVVQRHAGRAVEVNLADWIHHCAAFKCCSRCFAESTNQNPGGIKDGGEIANLLPAFVASNFKKKRKTFLLPRPTTSSFDLFCTFSAISHP